MTETVTETATETETDTEAGTRAAQRRAIGGLFVDVLLLLVFLSAVLALLGVGLFVWSVRERTFDQADRLALLPLRDDAVPARPRVAHAPLASCVRPSPETTTEPSDSAGNPANDALARRMK